ncbi:PilW family protein [Rugamonas apoptosis]|uniref:PilW family protein n=1 Tax=Rugamonas apoptosis TaxID=2758570 RepID=A0A7W2FFF2_9BURK|nr:PilW family protein [Rugamonas apoptosis]MBA5690696.1 PilW family protein [Rugamonas apoptosis]
MFRPSRKQHGFTLVEIMVAAVIGLMVLAAMTTMFVSNSQSQAEVEKSNRQIENGRYAVQLLSDELRNASYYGEFDPTVLAPPAALAAPCSVVLADLKAALPLYVQGYNDVASAPINCVPDVRTGTDILVVRHASSCLITDPSCEVNSAGAPFFQASLCGNLSELGSGNSADFYALGATAAAMTRHQRDCTATAGSGTAATVRFLEIHIYFIANNDKDGDGIPTLKRAEIANNGGALSVAIVPLAEGVENLQLEYGIDTNGDGATDAYTPDPATFGGCATASCAVTNWTSIVSAKVHVLARNIDKSAGYTDTKSYVLGAMADGTPNLIAAANDHYKRHAFDATVVLSNPAGRKAQ